MAKKKKNKNVAPQPVETPPAVDPDAVVSTPAVEVRVAVIQGIAGSSAAARCPTCGCTDRGTYKKINETSHLGDHLGVPFTHILWLGCKCAKCGQYRVDKVFENRN